MNYIKEVVEKKTFVPKIGEKFYTYTYYDSNDIRIIKHIWNNSCLNKQRKAFGIVFKTEQEAKDYLPTWEKRLEGEDC